MRSRLGRALAACLSAALLGACTLPAAVSPEGGETGAGLGRKPLKALARQPGVPNGQPRSGVASVRFDLVPGNTEDPSPGTDEVPGVEFQRGGASWYGPGFHNKLTANGERFDMWGMTAAHRTLPFNSRVCVTSLVNGKKVLVRVNDRGPYASGRIIDLSRGAAEALDMVGVGIKQVSLSLLDKQGGVCGAVSVPAAYPDDDPVANGNNGKAKAAKARPVHRKRGARPRH